MDLKEFIRIFAEIEKELKVMNNRLNSDSPEQQAWASRNLEKINTLKEELKALYATCTEAMRNTSFKDLPVSLGDLETNINDWLGDEAL